MYAAPQHDEGQIIPREDGSARRDQLHLELGEAYASPEDNWRGRRIYRLADELADVERAIAELHRGDEHTKF